MSGSFRPLQAIRIAQWGGDDRRTCIKETRGMARRERPMIVETSRAEKVRGMSVVYANIVDTCPKICAFHPVELRR